MQSIYTDMADQGIKYASADDGHPPRKLTSYPLYRSSPLQNAPKNIFGDECAAHNENIVIKKSLRTRKV